jgi:hypothetical protein
VGLVAFSRVGPLVVLVLVGHGLRVHTGIRGKESIHMIKVKVTLHKLSLLKAQLCLILVLIGNCLTRDERVK